MFKSTLTKSLLAFVALATSAGAAKLEVVDIASAAMRQSFKCQVILPDSYDGKTPLPQLFLLHGAGGNHVNWTDKIGGTKEAADALGRIIVCPTAGPTSWYNGDNNSDRYIANEVVKYIDKNYKTKPDRWIMGFSMGGFGALHLGMQNPDTFSAVAAFAPCIKPSEWWKKGKWDLKKAMDKKGERGGYDLFEKPMLSKLKNDKRTFVVLCGNKDFFYPEVKEAVQKAEKEGIKLNWQETEGGHTGPWAKEAFYKAIEVLDAAAAAKLKAKPAAAPAAKPAA